MKKLTIIFIRDDKNNPVQIRIPCASNFGFLVFCFATFGLGLWVFFSTLISSNTKNREILLENQKLRVSLVLNTQLSTVKNSAELKTVEKNQHFDNFNAENIAKTGVEHQLNFLTVTAKLKN